MNRRKLITAGAGLTAGLTATALGARAASAASWTRQDFGYYIEKPYDLAVADRYDYADGVHAMWVRDTDAPFEEGSTTLPRTEMRWQNNYASGAHRWGGDIYVPSGTDGACVLQILRIIRPEGTAATDIQLRATAEDGGTLRYYTGTDRILATGIYDTWIDVKMEHYTGAGEIHVYVNDELKLQVADRGPATRYFKNGVYGGAGRVEARFRNLRYWVLA